MVVQHFTNRQQLEKGRISVSKSNKWALLIGSIAVLGNTLAGITNTNSFPFSCYPTFQNILHDSYPTLDLEQMQESGDWLVLDKKLLRVKYRAERIRFWEVEIISLYEKEQQELMQQKLVVLLNLWKSEGIIRKGAKLRVVLNEFYGDDFDRIDQPTPVVIYEDIFLD